MVRVVHVPTIQGLIREILGTNFEGLSPSNEALMFSIYYAAVTSMEEEDVSLSPPFFWVRHRDTNVAQIAKNFGKSKADLSLRYRLGLEYSLAKADFLNVPDLVLVQAFAIFLLLARRHDSPRFVW